MKNNFGYNNTPYRKKKSAKKTVPVYFRAVDDDGEWNYLWNKFGDWRVWKYYKTEKDAEQAIIGLNRGSKIFEFKT